MRISGGSARGRSIPLRKEILRGPDLRPTSAKVRKAVFDILGPRIEGAVFLDLYAGSGAVGMEAVSRGAATVIFVDSGDSRIRAIRGMVSRLDFTERAMAERSEALPFLRKTPFVFDVIFADPPYSSQDIDGLLHLLGGNATLREGGRMIVEHSSKRPLPPGAGNLRRLKTYRYGDTALTLYEKDTT